MNIKDCQLHKCLHLLTCDIKQLHLFMKLNSNVFREENSNVACTTVFDIFVASKTNWYDEIPRPSIHSNLSDMSSTKNMLKEEEVCSCVYIIYILLVLFEIKLEHSDRAILCPSV